MKKLLLLTSASVFYGQISASCTLYVDPATISQQSQAYHNLSLSISNMESKVQSQLSAEQKKAEAAYITATDKFSQETINNNFQRLQEDLKRSFKHEFEDSQKMLDASLKEAEEKYLKHRNELAKKNNEELCSAIINITPNMIVAPEFDITKNIMEKFDEIVLEKKSVSKSAVESKLFLAKSKSSEDASESKETLAEKKRVYTADDLQKLIKPAPESKAVQTA